MRIQQNTGIRGAQRFAPKAGWAVLWRHESDRSPARVRPGMLEGRDGHHVAEGIGREEATDPKPFRLT
jgi:hypothetical protein